MPAAVSPSNATLGLTRALFASSTPSAARDLPMGAGAPSFSSTLQNRLEAAPPAREPGANLDGTNRPRDAERPAETERPADPQRPSDPEHTAAAESPAEPTRDGTDPGSDKGSTPDAAKGAPAAQKGQHAVAGKGQHDASAQQPDENPTAEMAATVAEDAAAAATTLDAADASVLLALGKAGVPRGKGVSDSTDQPANAVATTAIDAGLPAELAALLPQLAATRAADGAPAQVPASDDSLGKSLQNSGLLPRMETGTQGPDRGVASALMMLQARENAASAAAGKLVGGLQDVEATGAAPGANAAPSAPGSALPHPLSEFAAIRGQAIAARPLTPQLPVHTPVGQEGWAEDVGNRVTWMLGRAESKAELVLTPPNLGKLEVSINLNGDQTTAQFIAANQAARDALEQALPRLREMLAGAGINLGETSVSTSGEQQAGRDDGGSGRHRGQGDGTVGGGAATAWLRQHDGMVDTFV